MVIKAYKGFNKDMTCRGFQYEEGKDYETNSVKVCKKGFHACEYPLDVFRYYEPSKSVFHEVELDGDIDKDIDNTKVSSTKIHIGAMLDIVGLVNASIDYVKSKCAKENNSTGDWSANSATGYWSANSATGYGSANSATGDGSANSATGDRSANSATGYGSANSATGYGSANVSTGSNCINESNGEAGISVCWGSDSKAKGEIGNYLVLSEWKDGILINAKMRKVDGKHIKANTLYMLKDGKFVEVE